jgi:NADPH-dependent 2,4-dienoyl-CoA reductase/sulfur reductase-like enzyme
LSLSRVDTVGVVAHLAKEQRDGVRQLAWVVAREVRHNLLDCVTKRLGVGEDDDLHVLDQAEPSAQPAMGQVGKTPTLAPASMNGERHRSVRIASALP